MGAGLFTVFFPPVAAVVLSEGSVKIPGTLRVTPKPDQAEAIAARAGAKWSEAAMEGQDGARLCAWLFEPEADNGGAVIILHGVGDSRRGTAPMAEMFLRHGYRVLVPDGRGHGTSDAGLVTYGLREKDDVRQWVHWLKASRGVRRFYGVGESMGAAVLLQALPLAPEFRAAVAESGFADFHQAAYDRLSGRFGVPRILVTPLVEAGLFYVRTKYGIDLTEARPEEALRSVKTPVLLIHGTEDTNIPPAHSRRLYQMRPENSELWEPPGVSHTAAARMFPDEFERRVVEWFRKHP
jgi:hypothetical protein